jgi:hypothetical protein
MMRYSEARTASFCRRASVFANWAATAGDEARKRSSKTSKKCSAAMQRSKLSAKTRSQRMSSGISDRVGRWSV